jgi:hypothetical protein
MTRAQVRAYWKMLAALDVTVGNIKSLGPAGALGESYRVWLRVVEEAKEDAEATYAAARPSSRSRGSQQPAQGS